MVGVRDTLSVLQRRYVRPRAVRRRGSAEWRGVNLGSGLVRVEGFCAIDIAGPADLLVDLSRHGIPFPDSSLEAVVCMSAINYFARSRAAELIAETHRVLRDGGVARFGSQDMKSLARRYVENDERFFFQTLDDGRERFPGPTIGDKFAAWFYGHETAGGPCRYFYDYESLAHLFAEAGFLVVERRAYRDSRLSEVDLLDNRPGQMFFLEAVK
jgi:predicted SAM-dependent methyltransferase